MVEQLPRVGDDDFIAWGPPSGADLQHQRGLAGQRLFGDADKRRRPDGAVHPHLAETLDAGADLRGIDLAVDLLVRDDDLCGRVARDRRVGRADLERCRRP